MRTTILIPTDFTMESLKPLQSIVQIQEEESITLLLVHGIHLSTSITDLLFFDQSKLKKEFVTKEFQLGLDHLKLHCGNKSVEIQILFFTGFTQSAFNNFVTANGVDRLIIPSGYGYNTSHKYSSEIIPYFMNSKVDRQLVSWDNHSFSDDAINLSPSWS